MAKQLAHKVREQAADRARRARRQVALLVPLIVAVFLTFRYRSELFGLDLEVRVACVVVLIVLGWAFARDLGRVLRPVLLRRLDVGTAGTVSFLIRLLTLGLTTLVAFRLGGLRLATLAVGGAITAVIFGLAAQQTFGNLFAGTVLMSARPFKVGDLVRLQSGSVVATPTRSDPHIELEEVDSDKVVVRIAATPRSEEDGAKLADEVLAAVGQATPEADPTPR